MAEIGKPQRIIEIMPIQEPILVPEKAPVPEREKEPVPV